MFLHAFEVLKMVNGSVYCLRRGCGSTKHLVESELVHPPLPWFIINHFKFQKNFFGVWKIDCQGVNS